MPKRVALYARVSTSEQTTAPQLHALRAARPGLICLEEARARGATRVPPVPSSRSLRHGQAAAKVSQ